MQHSDLLRGKYCLFVVKETLNGLQDRQVAVNRKDKDNLSLIELVEYIFSKL